MKIPKEKVMIHVREGGFVSANDIIAILYERGQTKLAKEITERVFKALECIEYKKTHKTMEMKWKDLD